MVVRWRFTDPVTSSVYVFELNPNEGGSPAYEHNFSYKNTAAPNGKTLIFEGRDNPQKIEFSGVILTQAHYDAFVEWWQKKYQVHVTDDLGRTFSFIIESFVPKRVRAATKPWKHNYNVSATIVNWL